MKINLILFSSELHDRKSLLETRGCLFDGLRSFSNINIIEASDYNAIVEASSKNGKDDCLTILFIASGGTEEMFLNLLPFISLPIVIIADAYHNSLAAAYEICTWLANNNIENTLISIPQNPQKEFFSQLNNKLMLIIRQLQIKHKMSGMKIGLIGGSSSWLIASQINKVEVANKYGIQFIEINTSEVTNLYFNLLEGHTCTNTDSLFLKYKQFLDASRTEEDLQKAIILYYALKQICQKYSLNAITVKCFDIVSICNTTACLALSILNNQEIVAGCEGDIPAMFTLLALKLFNNNAGFIVNPAAIDEENLTVDFSHCTIPLSMTYKYSLPSHFETNKGIGIKGYLPKGKYAIVKISGNNLDKVYSCEGEIIESPYIAARCRTQIRFKFNNKEDFKVFVNNRLGNHMIITKVE